MGNQQKVYGSHFTQQLDWVSVQSIKPYDSGGEKQDLIGRQNNITFNSMLVKQYNRTYITEITKPDVMKRTGIHAVLRMMTCTSPRKQRLLTVGESSETC